MKSWAVADGVNFIPDETRPGRSGRPSDRTYIYLARKPSFASFEKDRHGPSTFVHFKLGHNTRSKKKKKRPFLGSLQQLNMAVKSAALLVSVLASSIAAQQCERMVTLRVPDILGSGETYEASIVTADATSTVFTLACPQASVCEYSTRTNTFTDMPATESYAFNFRETVTRSSDDQTSTVL